MQMRPHRISLQRAYQGRGRSSSYDGDSNQNTTIMTVMLTTGEGIDKSKHEREDRPVDRPVD
jgi:hypothetical protein